MATGQAIDSLRYEVGIDPTKAKRGAAQLGAMFNRISGRALFVGGAVASIGFVAFLSMKKAIKIAEEFETAWAEVSTILNATRGENEALSEAILELSTIIPASAPALAKGFYQTISAGIIDAADAQLVLEQAAKTATAGLTTVFKSVDVITTVLNAYKKEAKEVGDVSDVLFSVVREGKVTFDVLADSIGLAIPFAAQAGVSIEELGAALATLTKGGLNAHIATTALRSMLVQIIKPSDQAIAVSEKLGIQFDTTALKAKGLGEFIREIGEKSEGSEVILAQLFGNIRGLAAIFALAGNQADEFERILDITTNKTLFAADKAFERMMETTSAQAAVVKNELNLEWKKFGDNLLTGVVRPLLQTVDSFETSNKELVEGSKNLGKRVAFMNNELPSLIEKYKKLTLNTNRSAKENAELEFIITSVTDAFPGLIAKINEHGKAMEINLGKLKSYKDALNLQLLTENEKVLGSLIEQWQASRKAATEAAEAVEALQDPLWWTGKGTGDVTNKSIELAKIWGVLSVEGKNLAGVGETQADAINNMNNVVLPKAISEWQKVGQKQSALADIFERSVAGIVEAAGLGDLLSLWVQWQESIDDTSRKQLPMLSSQLSELQLKLQAIFKSDNLELGEVKQLLLAVDAIIKGKGFQSTVVPSNKKELSAAAKRAADIYQTEFERKENEIREFIEGMAGKFGEAAWISFQEEQPEALAFFERLFRKRKAQERELAEENAEQLVRFLEEKLAKSEPLSALQLGLAQAMGVSGDFTPQFDVVEARRTLEAAIADIETSIRFIDSDVKANIISAGLGMEDVGSLIDELPEELKEIVARLLLRMRASGADISDADILLLLKAIGAEGKASAKAIDQLVSGLDLLGKALPGIGGTVSFLTGAITRFAQASASGAGPIGFAIAGISTVVELFTGLGSSFDEAAVRARIFDEEVDELANSMAEFSAAVKDDPGPALLRRLEQLEKALAVAQNSELFNLQGQLNQGVVDAIKSAFAAAGLNPDLVLDLIKLGDLESFISQEVSVVRQAILDLGKFIVDSFADVMEKLRFEFDLFDIDDPAQKIKMFLDQVLETTGIDLTALANVGAEEMEKAIENIGGLVTGLIPGLDEMIERINSDTPVLLTGKPIGQDEINQIAKALGISAADVVRLLESMLLGSGLNGDELKAMILELENLNDELNDANEIGEQNLSVSRNVTITAQQGDSIIALMHSFTVMIRSIMDAALQSVTVLRNIESMLGSGGVGGSTTINANVQISSGRGSIQSIARASGDAVAVEVESQLRGKGFKLIGQGR